MSYEHVGATRCGAYKTYLPRHLSTLLRSIFTCARAEGRRAGYLTAANSTIMQAWKKNAGDRRSSNVADDARTAAALLSVAWRRAVANPPLPP